jgi:hypothetical protein
VLLDMLSRHKGNLSIKDISQLTAIKPGPTPKDAEAATNINL